MPTSGAGLVEIADSHVRLSVERWLLCRAMSLAATSRGKQDTKKV